MNVGPLGNIRSNHYFVTIGTIRPYSGYFIKKTPRLKRGFTTLEFVAVPECVHEVCEREPIAGVAGDQSLIAGDVVAERRQSRSRLRLDGSVLVLQ